MLQSFPGLPLTSFFSKNRFRLRVRGRLAILLIPIAAAATMAFVASASRKASSGTGVVPVKTQGKGVNPLAVNITATLADDILTSAKKNPGDTITYSATITNSGTAASNVIYTDVLDNKTTLVGGSVKTTPIAFDDTYGVIGNVRIQPNAAAGLLVNDIDPDTGTNAGLTATSTAVSSTQCAACSNVSINADGSFVYNPPSGFEGSDTFTYTVNDPTGKTGTGTVTLIVSGMIWFINNNAAACTTFPAGNCGRLTNPFSTLAAFQAVNNVGTNHPKANDNIFIYESTSSYTGPVTLLNGQKLIGQDSNTSLQTLTSLIPPTGSDAFPTMNTGGNATTITGATNAVNLNGVGAGGLNNLNGFTVGNSNPGISGTNFGTVTVGDVIINSTGQALSLNTGSVTIPANYAGFSSITSTGGPNNVSLTTISGTVNLGSGALSGATGNAFVVSGGGAAVSYTGTITQNNAARVVDIQSTTGGTITLSGTITGGASSTGVNLVSDNGNVTFTTLVLGTSGSRINNQAVTITNGTGTYGLGAVSIFTNNVQGIAATNADGTLNSTSGTVDAGNATAVNIDGPAALTTLGMTLTRVDSDDAAGSATGIIIQDTNGSFTVNGDGTNTTRGGNSSGGVISGKSGADGATTTGNGVYLSNAAGVTLRRMTINGTNQNHGIRGVNSSNFKLEYSTVSGTNGTDAATDEGSVNFDNWTGTGAITGCIIEGGFEDNLNVVNTSGTLDRLVITDCTFGFNSTANGNNNILIESINAGTLLKYTIQSSLIRGARADWLNAEPSAGGMLDAIIGGSTPALGNTFSNLSPDNHPAPVANGNRILLQANGTSTLNIQNNIIKGSLGSAIATNSLSATALMNGTIKSNTIGVAATANSGSTSASGISIQSTAGGDVTVLIDANSVFQYNNHAILFTLGDQMGSPPTINATITNNITNTPGNLLSNFNGFHLNNGTVSTDSFTTCMDIHDNNFTGGGQGSVPPNDDDVRLRQRQGTTVQLPGYTGPARDNTDFIVNEVINTSITGDLLVTSGTLDLLSFTANRTVSGGQISISNGATLKIGGGNTFPTNYTANILGQTSNVEYEGSGSQTIRALNYGNLISSGSGGRTLVSSTYNNVQVDNGGTLAGVNATTINVSGNWTIDIGGVFTPNGNTVNFNGSGAQLIGGTATAANATTFNNLTIANGGSGVSLGHNITVNGALTLTNDLNTGVNVLIMPAGASSAGAGDVVGNIKRTGPVSGACAITPCANTLSFGNPNNQITITSGTAPADITVNLDKNAPSGPGFGFPGAVQRTYTITPTGGSSIMATLQLRYLLGEVNGNNEATLRFWRFNGTVWIAIRIDDLAGDRSVCGRR